MVNRSQLLVDFPAMTSLLGDLTSFYRRVLPRFALHGRSTNPSKIRIAKLLETLNYSTIDQLSMETLPPHKITFIEKVMMQRFLLEWVPLKVVATEYPYLKSSLLSVVLIGHRRQLTALFETTLASKLAVTSKIGTKV